MNTNAKEGTIEPYSQILTPLTPLFSYSQLETLLCAWVPHRLDGILERRGLKSGLYVIDHFVVTATIALLLVSVKLLVTYIKNTLEKRHAPSERHYQSISVTIHPFITDSYHNIANVFHQSLAYLISEKTKTWTSGSFSLQACLDIGHDENNPPIFNVVPDLNQGKLCLRILELNIGVCHSLWGFKLNKIVLLAAVEIRYQGYSFNARFIEKEKSLNPATNELNTPDDLASRKLGIGAINEPPIEVWCKPQHGMATVEDLSTVIKRIAKEYMEMVEAQKRTVRSRYEYSASGKWSRVCNLPDIRGLETVALSLEHEELLNRSLSSFETSKDFYARIGSPWRKGILLYGCPGTGKTSLVFAIASALKRDIYFMNLNNIDSDSELLSAFASIPRKSMVVFEDVDAMTPVLHRRDAGQPFQERGEDQKFGLSTMLSVLDGHTLEEGIIFVMTTNYVEKLDPALTRPGRMDLHLQLKYATHHQIQHIYSLVGGEALEDIYPAFRREIPELVIPPSEIMQLMVLLRNNKHLIQQQLRELVIKNGAIIQD